MRITGLEVQQYKVGQRLTKDGVDTGLTLTNGATHSYLQPTTAGSKTLEWSGGISLLSKELLRGFRGK